MEITVFTGESFDETWATVFEGFLSHEQIEHLAKRYQEQLGLQDHKVEQTGNGYYIEFYPEPKIKTRTEEDAEVPEDDWEDEFRNYEPEAQAWAQVFFQETMTPPAIDETPMEELIRDINELQ